MVQVRRQDGCLKTAVNSGHSRFRGVRKLKRLSVQGAPEEFKLVDFLSQAHTGRHTTHDAAGSTGLKGAKPHDMSGKNYSSAGNGGSVSGDGAGSAGIDTVGEAAGGCPSISFPFEPYEVQRQLMRKIYDTLDKGGIGIFESPTGTVSASVVTANSRTSSCSAPCVWSRETR